MEQGDIRVNFGVQAYPQHYTQSLPGSEIERSNPIADIDNELNKLLKKPGPGRPLTHIFPYQITEARKLTLTKHAETKKKQEIELKAQADELMKTNKVLNEKMLMLKNQTIISSTKEREIKVMLLRARDRLNPDKSDMSTLASESDIFTKSGKKLLSQKRGAIATHRCRERKMKEEMKLKHKVEVLPGINNELLKVIQWMESVAAAEKSVFTFLEL